MGWAGLVICGLILALLWAMVGWWQEKHWRKALERELVELRQNTLGGNDD